MTNNRNSAIFIHINKTGGSSIKAALNLHHEHLTAQEKRAHTGPELWEESFVFSFVRNPWDKVVSHYHWRIATNQTGLGNNPIDFSEWVKRSYGDQDPLYFDKPKMFMPQTLWLIDESRNSIVDFVGRYESLQSDFQKICSHLGISVSLPHLKATDRQDYQHYYNSKSSEIVRDWFAEDIEKFGYKF